MKDIELLINRFLAGETTREEETRLYGLLQSEDATEEQKMLLGIIRPAADEPDTDAWLMEDMTEEYDRIVAGRRRRTFFVRFAAAAAVVAFVFLAVQKIGNREDDKALVVAKAETERTIKEVGKTFKNVASAAGNTPQDIPASAEKTVGKAEKPMRPEAFEGGLIASASASEVVSESMTLADSLTDIIERIEKGLENVSDSVYMARVEELFESDERLQDLMKKVMRKRLIMDDKNMEAYEQW